MLDDDDDEYWGLTSGESARFHARLSAYHRHRAGLLGAAAAVNSRKARRAAIASLCCWLLFLAIQIYKLVTHG